MRPPSELVASTIAYYEQNAGSFCERTLNADMGPLHEAFLAGLPAGGRVLDAGSGSGRDSAAFLSRGFDVVSIDASEQMVRATSVLTGRPAQQMRFDEVAFDAEFDGVWASASLLHVPRVNLSDALSRLARALRPGGLLYMSFKSGSGERLDRGRLFTDMDRSSLRRLLESAGTLQLHRVWESSDVRNDQSSGRWLNALAKRP